MRKSIYVVLILLLNIGLFAQRRKELMQYALKNSEGIVVVEGKYYIKKFKSGLELEVPVGEWREYYDSSGSLQKRYHYKKGRYSGPSETYYPNGKIMLKGKYHYKYSYKVERKANGEEYIYHVPYGIWEEFNEEGVLLRRIKYNKKGKIVREEKVGG